MKHEFDFELYLFVYFFGNQLATDLLTCFVFIYRKASIERINTSTTLGLSLHDSGNANHAFENNVYTLEFNEPNTEQAKPAAT